MKSLLSLLTERRITTTLVLGFSAGLPLTLSGSTLAAWYTDAGLSLKEIGWASLATAPYTFKFLWAPFMDRWVPPLLGRRRGWILLCQLLLCVMVACMIFLTPVSHPKILFTVACLVAFFSASQDIAIDAYRTDILHPDERPMGAAMYTNGYRIAMLVSGGGALIIAGIWGWHITYSFMVVTIAVCTLATWFGPEPEIKVKPPTRLWDCTVLPFLDFLKRPHALWILLLVVFYKLGDAFAGAMSQTFLMREIHFTLIEMGTMAKTLGFLGTIVGTTLGAIWMSRMGWFKALILFGIFQAISNLAYMPLLWTGPDYFIAGSALMIENICGGMGTTAFFALLMALCNARFSAFQYALLSSLSSVGRVFVGPLAGIIASDYGWNAYFLASVILSIPGIGLLIWLKNSVQTTMNDREEERLALSSTS